MSKKALKTDAKAKLILLSQIEDFAVQNGIEIDCLYDIEIAKEVFSPELKRLEDLVDECDDNLLGMNGVDGRYFDLLMDIEEMFEKYIPELAEHELHHSGIYMECIRPYRKIVNQRRSSYCRRVWEINVYLDACNNFRLLAEISKANPGVLTDRMWNSIRQVSGPHECFAEESS